MAGIGEGTGPLSVEIPVERVRQYVYQVGWTEEWENVLKHFSFPRFTLMKDLGSTFP